MKTRAIYFLYRLVQVLASPVLLLYFLTRIARNRAYWGTMSQRLGFLPRSYRQTSPGAIWLHTVSVGEVLASLEIVRQLRAEFPAAPLFISASTLAGYATAQAKLASRATGVFYAPLDFVFAVRRVIRALQPSLLLIVETEIWPNLVREVRRTGAAVAIVNGRISDRAAPRYFRMAPFFRHVLPHFNLILAQNEEMRARFIRTGAPCETAVAAGNLKYDFAAREAPPDSPPRQFIERHRPAAVWIAASTMPPAVPGDIDEDDAVLAAFAALAARRPDLLLVLVPRKPESFDTAARKLAAAGVPYLRRSALTPDAALSLPGVLLLDTIGELSGLFAFSDAVFMGGTLAARGGHNILEPAFFGKPVIVGPHMENFQEIADEFRRAGACIGIPSPAELATAVEQAFSGGAEIGRRALACAEARRGATARAVAASRALYDAHLPRYRPAQPWYSVARCLTLLWDFGGRLQRSRNLARRRHLPVPVVSIGNLTMGGTGKTPCTLFVAGLLRQHGYQPGILTRGYGRHSPVRHLAVPPGAGLTTEQSGDEPQIFLRAAVAPVGIGPDRCRTGALLVERHASNILILDDGFQHLRLHRDTDVVLIDAFRPFGGGELFPLGFLREPLSSLSRAHVFVITRAGASPLTPAIERTLGSHNPRAPIFHARVTPLAWVDHATGWEHCLTEPPFHRAAALCGLGNHRSFWHTLDALGITPVQKFEFDDHHHYRPHELRRIAATPGADALLTTQKDSVNLCDGAGTLVAPLKIYWLKVALEIEDPEAFLKALNLPPAP